MVTEKRWSYMNARWEHKPSKKKIYWGRKEDFGKNVSSKIIKSIISSYGNNFSNICQVILLFGNFKYNAIHAFLLVYKSQFWYREVDNDKYIV